MNRRTGIRIATGDQREDLSYSSYALANEKTRTKVRQIEMAAKPRMKRVAPSMKALSVSSGEMCYQVAHPKQHRGTKLRAMKIARKVCLSAEAIVESPRAPHKEHRLVLCKISGRFCPWNGSRLNPVHSA